MGQIHIRRKSKFITKLLENTNLKISFTAENTTAKLLTQKNKDINSNKFNRSGDYQLTYKECNKKYIGQTGRPFHKRFQEHFRDYKYGNGKSNFAHHLLDNSHSIVPMEDIGRYNGNNTHKEKRGKNDTLENFYIYKETKMDNQLMTHVQSKKTFCLTK